MEKNRAGRYMSLLLRHAPEKEGLEMDENGWVSVKQLVHRLDISMKTLEEIVEENDKQRFAFNSDKTKIRASQGHSIGVNLDLKETEPPDVLYHGTATKYLSSIYDEGIRRGRRDFVHLSKDEDTAKKVGSRHGEVFILIIDTKQMYEDDYKFYLSDNEVWLTEYVPVEYILN